MQASTLSQVPGFKMDEALDTSSFEIPPRTPTTPRTPNITSCAGGQIRHSLSPVLDPNWRVLKNTQYKIATNADKSATIPEKEFDRLTGFVIATDQPKSDKTKEPNQFPQRKLKFSSQPPQHAGSTMSLHPHGSNVAQPGTPVHSFPENKTLDIIEKKINRGDCDVPIGIGNIEAWHQVNNTYLNMMPEINLNQDTQESQDRNEQGGDVEAEEYMWGSLQQSMFFQQKGLHFSQGLNLDNRSNVYDDQS